MIDKNDAELEKFFKKDIIEFLDQQLVVKGAQTEIKQLEEAIQANDYKEAARIIEAAVEKFNRTDPKDVYREINYNKIIDLVRIAQTYTKNFEAKNRLTEDIELLNNSRDLEKSFSENIQVFEERQREEWKEQEKIEQKEADRAQEIENELVEINKQLFVSLRKRDVKEAIAQYQEYKKRFQEYPSRFKEEKKELYNDLIAFYMRIKQLNEELYHTKLDLEKIIPKEERRKVLKIEEIKRVVLEVKIDINEKKFKEAKAKIINLKHKISLIPEKYKNIKDKLEDIANILMKKLEFEKKLTG